MWLTPKPSWSDSMSTARARPTRSMPSTSASSPATRRRPSLLPSYGSIQPFGRMSKPWRALDRGLTRQTRPPSTGLMPRRQALGARSAEPPVSPSSYFFPPTTGRISRPGSRDLEPAPSSPKRPSDRTVSQMPGSSPVTRLTREADAF